MMFLKLLKHILQEVSKPKISTASTATSAPRQESKKDWKKPFVSKASDVTPTVQNRMVTCLEKLVRSPLKSKEEKEADMVDSALAKLQEFFKIYLSFETRHKSYLYEVFMNPEKAKVLLRLNTFEMIQPYVSRLCEEYDFETESLTYRCVKQKREMFEAGIGINYGVNNPNNIDVINPKDDQEL